jgi:predicted MFS family arabinose efflux permease
MFTFPQMLMAPPLGGFVGAAFAWSGGEIAIFVLIAFLVGSLLGIIWDALPRSADAGEREPAVLGSVARIASDQREAA